MLNENGAVFLDFCSSSLTNTAFDTYSEIKIEYSGSHVFAELTSNGKAVTAIINLTVPSSITTKTTSSTTTTSTTTTSTTTISTTTKSTTNASSNTYSCGVASVQPKMSDTRIVGGVEASPNSWPWQVYITDSKYMCGATLINKDWFGRI